MGVPFELNATLGILLGARGADLGSLLGVILEVLGRKVASSSYKTRITTDSLSPGVQTGGSNSQSARFVQHLKVGSSS